MSDVLTGKATAQDGAIAIHQGAFDRRFAQMAPHTHAVVSYTAEGLPYWQEFTAQYTAITFAEVVEAADEAHLDGIWITRAGVEAVLADRRSHPSS